jgi:hypothetical protein
LPGRHEYDRGERKAVGRDAMAVLGGCGVVILVVVLTYVVYAVLLVRSGWHGR